MRKLCPACRSELSPGYAVCFGCGAILVEGQRNLTGRPRQVLLTRWLVLAGWLAMAMGPAYAMLPSEWGAALLGTLVAGLGLGAALAGLVAQCPVAFVIGIVQALLGVLCGLVVLGCEDGTINEALGASIVALVTLVTAPAAIRFWQRPLKPADPWRCRRCGYSLYGLTTPRCPECGTAFHRSNLHWMRWGQPPPASSENVEPAFTAAWPPVPAAPPPASEKLGIAVDAHRMPDPAVVSATQELRL